MGVQAKRIHQLAPATIAEVVATAVFEVEIPVAGGEFKNKSVTQDQLKTIFGGSPAGGPDVAKRTSTSTDVFTGTQLIVPWQTGLILSPNIIYNGANNTRLTVDSDGIYQIGANIAVRSTDQRAQFAAAILINGLPATGFRSSSYIRNAGVSWDYWVMEIANEPFDLLKGDYIEIQIGQVGGVAWNYGGSAACAIRGQDSRIFVQKLAEPGITPVVEEVGRECIIRSTFDNPAYSYEVLKNDFGGVVDISINAPHEHHILIRESPGGNLLVDSNNQIYELTCTFGFPPLMSIQGTSARFNSKNGWNVKTGIVTSVWNSAGGDSLIKIRQILPNSDSKQ